MGSPVGQRQRLRKRGRQWLHNTLNRLNAIGTFISRSLNSTFIRKEKERPGKADPVNSPPRIRGTSDSSPSGAALGHPSLARESNALSVFYLGNKVTIENGPKI